MSGSKRRCAHRTRRSPTRSTPYSPPCSSDLADDAQRPTPGPAGDAISAVTGSPGTPGGVPDFDELAALYAERVSNYPDAPPGYLHQWAQLTAHLTSLGGRLVVPPLIPDTFLPQLLTDGATHCGGVRFHPGEPSQCHANASTLWAEGAAAAIGTGYTLTRDDNLWRQHSWALDTNGTIVETTTPRDVYHGLTLTGPAALFFAYSNATDVVQALVDEDPTPATAHLWAAAAEAVKLAHPAPPGR